MQSFSHLGSNWLVEGPTACDMAGLLTRKNGHSIAKCLEQWVCLPPGGAMPNVAHLVVVVAVEGGMCIAAKKGIGG